jgi:hypothetical protein
MPKNLRGVGVNRRDPLSIALETLKKWRISVRLARAQLHRAIGTVAF